jgi:hypothetical protein
MFITMAGSWPDGDLRLGVSISVDLKSGTNVSSGAGIDIWMSRYLYGYVNQVEVPGVLKVTAYQAPTSLTGSQPFNIKGSVEINDGTWKLSVPIDITATCNSTPNNIIK